MFLFSKVVESSSQSFSSGLSPYPLILYLVVYRFFARERTRGEAYVILTCHEGRGSGKPERAVWKEMTSISSQTSMECNMGPDRDNRHQCLHGCLQGC